MFWEVCLAELKMVEMLLSSLRNQLKAIPGFLVANLLNQNILSRSSRSSFLGMSPRSDSLRRLTLSDTYPVGRNGISCKVQIKNKSTHKALSKAVGESSLDHGNNLGESI